MSQRILKWVEAITPRAQSVPEQEWDRVKDKICELYRNTTLDEMMSSMSAEHGFNASRRQYITQLSKWKISKYITKSHSRKQKTSGGDNYMTRKRPKTETDQRVICSILPQNEQGDTLCAEPQSSQLEYKPTLSRLEPSSRDTEIPANVELFPPNSPRCSESLKEATGTATKTGPGSYRRVLHEFGYDDRGFSNCKETSVVIDPKATTSISPASNTTSQCEQLQSESSRRSLKSAHDIAMGALTLASSLSSDDYKSFSSLASSIASSAGSNLSCSNDRFSEFEIVSSDREPPLAPTQRTSTIDVLDSVENQLSELEMTSSISDREAEPKPAEENWTRYLDMDAISPESKADLLLPLQILSMVRALSLYSPQWSGNLPDYGSDNSAMGAQLDAASILLRDLLKHNDIWNVDYDDYRGPLHWQLKSLNDKLRAKQLQNEHRILKWLTNEDFTLGVAEMQESGRYGFVDTRMNHFASRIHSAVYQGSGTVSAQGPSNGQQRSQNCSRTRAGTSNEFI